MQAPSTTPPIAMNYPAFSYSTVRATVLALVAGLFTLVACDSADVSREVPTDVRFTASVGPSAAKTVSGHVIVEEAKMLVRTIKFTQVDDDPDDDESAESFKTGPYVVQLVAGGVPAEDPVTGFAEIVQGTLPEGAYSGLTWKIHKPEDDEVVEDPDFGGVGSERYSMIIEGTATDPVSGLNEPFRLAVNKTMKQRADFEEPVDVDAETEDFEVTVGTTVSDWFVDFDGTDLNPLDPAHLEKIENAIKRSFRVYEAT
jgi:hypothetical protein